MNRQGQVVSIVNREVEVKCFPGESSNCQSCNWGCGKRMPNLKAYLPEDFRKQTSIGDIVVVYIPDNSLFLLSTIIFLIPTLTLITGIIIGGNLFDHTHWGYLIGSIIGMIIGLILVIFLRRFVSFQPKVIELKKGGCNNG